MIDEIFINAYTAAIEFTLSSEDRDSHGYSNELLKQCREDCRAFLKQAAPIVLSSQNEMGVSEADLWTCAGYDFWLTRNGHGCGFWDGDWPEPQAAELTRIARTFGELSPYTGDDGLLYF